MDNLHSEVVIAKIELVRYHSSHEGALPYLYKVHSFQTTIVPHRGSELEAISIGGQV